MSPLFCLFACLLLGEKWPTNVAALSAAPYLEPGSVWTCWSASERAAAGKAAGWAVHPPPQGPAAPPAYPSCSAPIGTVLGPGKASTHVRLPVLSLLLHSPPPGTLFPTFLESVFLAFRSELKGPVLCNHFFDDYAAPYASCMDRMMCPPTLSAESPWGCDVS